VKATAVRHAEITILPNPRKQMPLYKYVLTTTDGQNIGGADSAQDMACMIDLLKDLYPVASLYVEEASAADGWDGWTPIDDLTTIRP
jgi:hypothetical protein